MGLPFTAGQLEELRSFRQQLNLEVAERYERDLRHDVMAQVHAYGDQCPSARGIIHWGATSCYVTDNSDLLVCREGLQLVRRRLMACLSRLADFARQYRALPCLAYTHLQPAQPTT
ncbi:MAG: adenylosuccinate lyase, partial [bacterium]